MSQTRKYSTVTILLGTTSVVLADAIEDANDRGQRVLVGKAVGGNFDRSMFGFGVEVRIGSLPIRRIAEGIYTVVDPHMLGGA